MFKERKEYNNTISIKLVIPGRCNAKCVFCYMEDYSNVMITDNQFTSFKENFITSLDYFLNKIDNKDHVSLDITGNEPTFYPETLIFVLKELKKFNIQDKVSRVTITTNGFNLSKCIDYFEGVINYVNISIHDFIKEERDKIMKCNTLTDDQYKELVKRLRDIGITTSAISVIHKRIDNFSEWLYDFIDWCKYIGFIGIRFRCNVFWKEQYLFDKYMEKTMNKEDFKVIIHENTPDSNWCRLRMNDKFRIFFLHGVLNNSDYTKGIEYIIHDDGKCYTDYYKKEPIKNYRYEIGKIYDNVDIYNVTNKEEFKQKVHMIAEDWLRTHWFTLTGAILHVDGYLYVMGEDSSGPGSRIGYAKINIETFEVVETYGSHDCPIKIKKCEYSNNLKGLMDEIFKNELLKKQNIK